MNAKVKMKKIEEQYDATSVSLSKAQIGLRLALYIASNRDCKSWAKYSLQELSDKIIKDVVNVAYVQMIRHSTEGVDQ